MDAEDSLTHLYRELADWYDRRAEQSMRDRFLVLAMDAAQRAGHADEAEALRRQLLQASPHHLLRPFASFTEATQAADVQTYLRDLRMNYPSEVAQVLLRSLRTNAHNLAPEVKPSLTLSSSKNTGEPLKVFYGVEPPTVLPNSQRAAPLPQRPEPAVARPAPTARRDHADPIPPERREERPPPAGDSWLGIILFGVLLVVSVVGVSFVLARPFAPSLVDAVKVPTK